MKIKQVRQNNRRKVFEVVTREQTYLFPYAKLEVQPSATDRIIEVCVDRELGNEAFTYRPESGCEGTVHIDHVLGYNQDPHMLRDLLLYKLTLEVQTRVAESPLSKREIIRRLGTSVPQFYRPLDQTNYQKSVGKCSLLAILDGKVDLAVREKVAWSVHF